MKPTDRTAPDRPYDVYAKLEDPMGVLSAAPRGGDDETRAKIRRAANTAMDAIDGMLLGCTPMRAPWSVEIPRQRRRDRRTGWTRRWGGQGRHARHAEETK